MNQPSYLLAISVGPVQDFIAASRKARDLWFGSDMLSDLSRTAADTLANAGAELIFPAPASLQQGHSVANKLLASTTFRPEELAEQARNAVIERIEELWDHDVTRRLSSELTGAVDHDLAKAQLQDFLEWYAAWVRYDPAKYTDARKEVERLLAGRKALRDFGRAAGVEQRPKSSLDPAHESVLIPNDEQAGALARSLHIKRGETLDAISLIKRLGGRNQTDGKSRFPSTARVAIDPVIRQALEHDVTSYALWLELHRDVETLAETDLAEAFDAGPDTPLSEYASFPFDTQLFYELSSARPIKELESWKNDPKYDRLILAVEQFIENVRELCDALPDIGDLPAYFAVLRADGDKMGKALNALTTIDAHIAFSEKLGIFALQARQKVIEHYGAMIYSGGDDVLAFLPLDTALPCADALRLEFERIMKEALQDYCDIELPALSVGIAIGHYSDHLQHLLQRSAQAERAAKKPRNALAVSLETRSGGGDARTIVHSWKTDPVYERWAFAIEVHRHDTFPDGAAYQLDRLRQEFAGAWNAGVFGNDQQLLHEILSKEVARILGRKRAKHGTEDLDAQLIAQLAARLEATAPNGLDTIAELRTLVDELIVARRIASLLPNSARTALGLWKGALQPIATSSAEPIAAGVTV